MSALTTMLRRFVEPATPFLSRSTRENALQPALARQDNFDIGRYLVQPTQ